MTGKEFFDLKLNDLKREALISAKALGESWAFIRAPWRRKVKLIVKESRKFLDVAELPTFEQMFGLNGKYFRAFNSDQKRKIEHVRAEIFNHFLYLIRAKIDTLSPTTSPECLLRLPITNKQGSFITKWAKKKGKIFFVHDLFQINRRRKVFSQNNEIDFQNVPFFYNGQHTMSSYRFWDGFDFHKWLLAEKEKRNTDYNA